MKRKRIITIILSLVMLFSLASCKEDQRTMQDENGIIHITYDRERGAYLHSLEENALCAKEILYAKITEQDIISGRLVHNGSKLKYIISKLNTNELDIKNPYE